MANTPHEIAVRDADGELWHYRRVSSVLQRRANWSSIWQRVHASDYETMTPAELRAVADVLECHVGMA